jgi:hypothetical protein
LNTAILPSSASISRPTVQRDETAAGEAEPQELGGVLDADRAVDRGRDGAEEADQLVLGNRRARRLEDEPGGASALRMARALRHVADIAVGDGDGERQAAVTILGDPLDSRPAFGERELGDLGAEAEDGDTGGAGPLGGGDLAGEGVAAERALLVEEGEQHRPRAADGHALPSPPSAGPAAHERRPRSSALFRRRLAADRLGGILPRRKNLSNKFLSGKLMPSVRPAGQTPWANIRVD